MQRAAQVVHAVREVSVPAVRLALVTAAPGPGGTRRIATRRPGHVELPQKVVAVTLRGDRAARDHGGRGGCRQERSRAGQEAP